MLPMVAAAMMGAMGQQTQSAGRSGANPAGMLGALLDSDGDGSVADDLLGLAGKFFGR